MSGRHGVEAWTSLPHPLCVFLPPMHACVGLSHTVPSCPWLPPFKLADVHGYIHIEREFTFPEEHLHRITRLALRSKACAGNLSLVPKFFSYFVLVRMTSKWISKSNSWQELAEVLKFSGQIFSVACNDLGVWIL